MDDESTSPKDATSGAVELMEMYRDMARAVSRQLEAARARDWRRMGELEDWIQGVRAEIEARQLPSPEDPSELRALIEAMLREQQQATMLVAAQRAVMADLIEGGGLEHGVDGWPGPIS